MEQRSDVEFRAEKLYKNTREKFGYLIREVVSNSIHAVLIKNPREVIVFSILASNLKSVEANRISPLKLATTGTDLMISIGLILQALIREMLRKKNCAFILRAREGLQSSTFLMRQHIRPLI